MTAYKPHYACFNCRKTFKRRLSSDIRKGLKNRGDEEEINVKCPECGGIMLDMGLDFESPPKKDIKAWEHLKNLYEAGITFHSCGCTGPGYIPKDKAALIAHIGRMRLLYIDHKHFWQHRTEPLTQKEKDKDFKENAHYLHAAPVERDPKTKRPQKAGIAKALQYWTERLEAIENKMKDLNSK